MNHELTGEIETIAFGGEGIIRPTNGPVTFIPFTAPGDHLTYRLTEQKKNFARGALETLLQPSEDRITPSCPHYGVCGGCQLQHVNYAAQLRYKRQWVQEAIERIGKIEDIQVKEVIPATQQWAYRRHISLTLSPQELGFEVGYIRHDLAGLVLTKVCPIFESDAHALFEEIRSFCRLLKPTSRPPGRAVILKGDNGAYFLDMHFDKLPKNAKEIFSQLTIGKTWQGISFQSPGNSFRKGQTESIFDVDGLKIHCSPRTFLQNHAEQSLKIYRRLKEVAQEVDAKRILDLYCGIGITSLLWGRDQRHVVGVESNREAVKLAAQNAAANGITTVSFYAEKVEAIIRQMIVKESPDFIFLNPPREGLIENIISEIGESKASHITYLSCMPATLARDLKRLKAVGFSPITIQPYDMFPQTTHVEVITTMQRKMHHPG